MVNGLLASASPYLNNYHMEDFLEREELVKKFNFLDGMDDNELITYAYRRFIESKESDVIEAIAKYFKTKSDKNSKQKTTSLEQNGPRYK